ncbi:MAG: ComEC/Rec2 family competence protein, partial [Pseudobutyrivibrio sp.]|nr:ComEC/Rec2 family competence protein [Pseudobutyrivibrio sp.]
MGRRLALISLLYVLIVAFSVYGPWDYLGAYNKANAAEQFLADGIYVQATGRITGKEIKNDKVLYYVDDADIICEGGCIKNSSFFFRFDSKQIPNNSKINIKGSVSHFSRARNDGGFDMKNYYNSLGYYFELKGASVDSVKPCSNDYREDLFRLSDRILSVYNELMPGEEAGFLASITIGNKSELNGDLKDLFQKVGVAHVLAVSGLHVSVVCMALYRVLRKRGFSFISGACVSGIVAVFYGLLTGGSVSSIRAIGMFLVYLLADILGESYDSLTALSLMAIILLADNPLIIKNAGFVFSFSAILCILLIVLPISNHYSAVCRQRNRLRIYDISLMARFRDWLVSSFVFSLSIFISMLPIVTSIYYETPIYSALINLVLLPFMPVLLGFGLVGGFVGLYSLGLAEIILFPCHFIIYIFEIVADKASKLPFGRVVVGKNGIGLLILYYVSLLMIVSLYTKEPKDEQLEAINPRKRLASTKKRFMALIFAICFIGVLWVIPSKVKFEVDILDVGQGDGIFVSSGDGVNYFIDGGSTTNDKVGKYVLSPFLKYKGVGAIDYWFISHMDLDHVSGVFELLEEGYPIRNIVVSKEIPRDETFNNLLLAAEENHTKVIYMGSGDSCGSKHLKFTCLYPFDGSTSDDINALSLALLMEYDKDLDGV